MKKVIVLLFLSLFVYAAPQAHAELVTLWSVGVVGAFDTGSVQWSGSPAGTSASTLSLRWGTSLGSGKSGLDISNPNGPTIVETDGAAVPNLSLTDLNRPITGTTLESIILNSTLTLTPFAPPGLPGLPEATLGFRINYLETPNGANPCADGGANGEGDNVNGCADIFAIDRSALNFPFQYDTDGDGPDPALTYFISFFESTSGLNPLSDAACAAVFGAPCATPVLGFETKEGLDTTAVFSALITSAPISIVPEPTSLLLLGTGLAGLGFLRKKMMGKK